MLCKTVKGEKDFFFVKTSKMRSEQWSVTVLDASVVNKLCETSDWKIH